MCSGEGVPWIEDRGETRSGTASWCPHQPHSHHGRMFLPWKGQAICKRAGDTPSGLPAGTEWTWKATASGVPEVFVLWCRSWAQDVWKINSVIYLGEGRQSWTMLDDKKVGWWWKLEHLGIPGLSQSRAELQEHRAPGSFHGHYLHLLFQIPKTQQLGGKMEELRLLFFRWEKQTQALGKS